jgi:Bacterial SH3 domain
VARIVALLLIVVPIVAVWVAFNASKAGPSPAAEEIANFDPRSLVQDNTPHFLPTPVAAIPADANVGPPAPSSSDSAAAPTEHVRVANTGGAGAILRADPPKGQQVAALRDGTVLEVIEHQALPDGSEWLHVRTAEGAEGWVFSRLVAAADQ